MKVSEFPRHHYTASLADHLHIHDGDTYRVDLILFGGGSSPFRNTFRTYLRLVNAWAPELSQAGGYETRDYARELLSEATTMYVRTHFDKFSFNRVLAQVWADVLTGGEELADINHMINAFVAEHGYSPGDTLRLVGTP